MAENENHTYVTGADGKRYKLSPVDGATEKSVRYSGHRASAKLILALAALIILALAGGAAMLLTKKQHTPLDIYAGKVDFSLYYPAKMPAGFSLKDGSVDIRNGVASYIVTNDSVNISVNQQAAPKEDINFNKLVGFKTTQISIGTLSVGTNLGTSTALVSTSKTLITINTNGTNHTSEVSELASQLTLVE